MKGELVVKLGGNAIAGAGLAAVAADLAELAGGGERILVVHGGGPQVTALQKRLGQQPQKIAGRRVTDEATLEVLAMVVGGKLNIDVCAALNAAGARPIGLHGASSLVIEARRRPPKRIQGGPAEPVDLGLVGDVTGVNVALLALLLDAGHLPVLACIGAARDGGVYNINADVVANELAVAMRARALVLITDRPGVLADPEDPTSRIPRLSRDAAHDALRAGTVSDGMIPKLEEAFAAIAAGVGRVHIVGGLGPGELLTELVMPGSRGTVLEG